MTSLWPSLQRLRVVTSSAYVSILASLSFSQSGYTTVQGFLSPGRTSQTGKSVKRLKGKAACTDFFLFVSLSLDKSYEAAFKKNWYVLCCKGPLLYKQNIVTIGMGSLM